MKEIDGPELNETTLTDQGGREVVVKSEVARLAADAKIRKELRDVIEPLRRQGIDTFEVSSGARSTVRLEKDDAPSFEFQRTEEPEVLSEKDLDDVYLEVLTVELEKGSARKWRFGGIGGSFIASIEDAEFMQKVARHEVVFGAGDQLRAQVKITQRREPLTGRIKETRRITKVCEWIKAPEQLGMLRGLLAPDVGDGRDRRQLVSGDPPSTEGGGGPDG